MVQLGFLIIWIIALLSWIVVNILIYRQLQTISALRRDVVGWFVAQLMFGCIFFCIALVSIYYIGPFFSTSSTQGTNGHF